MRALIVDDEPQAIALLQGYLQHFPSIEVAGSCRTAPKALTALQSQSIDLIFLDINMPQLSGLALARLIDTRRTKIIFTTAYAEHAVASYEVAAFDYLLKPISFERFTQAVSRVLREQVVQQGPSPAEPPEMITVKSGANTHLVNPIQIGYLEKDGNYLFYHLEGQRIMARQSVAEALATLPPYFLQIHKSYIVNVRQVEYFNKLEISVQGRKLPVGGSFREDVLYHLENPLR
ncbi:MAG: response regulator transcription factor [Lewinellaceae bacterium]|nr:response regulator transcription factor [Lewinellaceae bacterium]